ncbi:MAG: hypothetical protein MRZ90_02875 [Candidatus Gastranaerophilales bacterium]|nr:hypothetical protein [Candidatus Gastranaerophilales bacterium]
MVERLQTISVPTQQTIKRVDPKQVESNKTQSIESIQNSTKIIQDLQEQINAKTTLIYSWQNLANLVTNQILSGKLSESDVRSSKYMVNDLNIQIENTKKEIEELNAKLQAEKNNASQDNITKDETQKSQVMAQNVLALKSTNEQQKH